LHSQRDHSFDDFLLIPKVGLARRFWIEAGNAQSLIPVTVDPNPLIVDVGIFPLEVLGKDIAGFFVNLSDIERFEAFPDIKCAEKVEMWKVRKLRCGVPTNFS
jgi:hypothetical protein